MSFQWRSGEKSLGSTLNEINIQEISREDIEQVYSLARKQKLYGKEKPKAYNFPTAFFSTLNSIIADSRTLTTIVQCSSFFVNDWGVKRNIPQMDSLLLRLMKKKVNIRLTERTKKHIKLVIQTKTEQLDHILPILKYFDLIIVSIGKNRDFTTIASYNNESSIKQHLAEELARKSIKKFPKTSRRYPFQKLPSTEDYYFLQEVSSFIFEWLKFRHGTLQKVINGNEIIFYRYHYRPEKKLLSFDNIDSLISEITKGAFSFSPDIAGLGNEYVLTIDIDPRFNTPYSLVTRYIRDFSAYLDECRIHYQISYSGNRGFHFRIPTLYPDVSGSDKALYGYILARIESFDTLMTRRALEYPFLILRDALEILLVRYNLNTKLDPVGLCNIPKYSRNLPIYFDNRVVKGGGGVRVPGSFNFKSGLYCRNYTIETIPFSKTKLADESKRDFILGHEEESLKYHDMSTEEKKSNFIHLISISNGFVEQNFKDLLYNMELFKTD